MDNVWEKDDGDGHLPFEEYERQQKKDMVTIDAFVQPTRISIRGPKARQQQQEPQKRIPFEKHYMTIYNQYINEKFEHLHEEESFSCNTQSSGEESGDEDSTSSLGEGGRKRKRSPQTVLVEKRPKKFDASHPYECFLCGWGDVQHDSIEAEHIILMLNIINVNRGIHSNHDISLQVHQYFMSDVYDPESGMEILTPEIVYDHLVGIHSLDASLYIAERIRKRKQYLFMMEQNLVFEDGTIDIEIQKLIDKNESITLELYGKKPSNMMFSNGNGAEDMKRQANSVALLPRMEKVSTRKAKRRVNF